MKPELKLAKWRYCVLLFAKILGNVTEACKQRGMHKSQYYVYKKRYLEQGMEGLKD